MFQIGLITITAKTYTGIWCGVVVCVLKTKEKFQIESEAKKLPHGKISTSYSLQALSHINVLIWSSVDHSTINVHRVDLYVR